MISILDNERLKKIGEQLRRGDLNYYQFYNVEFSADEYLFQEYMEEFKESADPNSKILNKSYYDIEVHYNPAVFPDSKKADYAINSIALFNNIKNKVIIFACPYWEKHPITGKKGHSNLTDPKTIEENIKNLYQELVSKNPTYLIENLKIELRLFKKEISLLKNFFLAARELGSLFLIGFNNQIFDDPYVVNRGLKIAGEDIYNSITEFGEIQKFGEFSYEWPDYTKVDLLSMYKPVDQGGQGFGRSLPNYKLGTVAEAELGINKLDISNLNESYENNITEFLTYNLLDTLLTFKLDEKLRFLELNWMLAKYNTAPMSSAIRGRSLMYRYRNDLIYTKRGELIRAKMYNKDIFYPVLEVQAK